MSLAMESSDGLRRQVLVGGFISNSPICNRGNEMNQTQDRLHPAINIVHSTPTTVTRTPLVSVSTTPVFTPINLSPNSRSTALTSSPSSSEAHASPTTWTPPQKSTHSSLPSPFSSPRKRAISPILNLAKIDETKVLETPELGIISNIPDIKITSATPGINKGMTVADHIQRFECHDVKHYPAESEFENVSLRLNSLSLSPALDRSTGLVMSPSDGSGGPKRFLKFRRSDIKFGKFIGKGGFGFVHAGIIAGNPVAVKIVQKRRGSGIHREILQAERLAFGLKLRHQNIVAIYGINLCEELRGDALILMELVTSQSLQALLDDVTTVIKTKERLDYAHQVAKALNYLHGNQVVHLDVKPANVLMTSDHVCKLSDFGSLTLTGPQIDKEEPEFTQLLGTLPYRAPELMRCLYPSTKADIYSCGILLWQMLTRESPHKNTNPHALIYQLVANDLRPSIPETGDDVIEVMYKDLYTSCWSRDLNERPEAGDIISTIQNILQHVQT